MKTDFLSDLQSLDLNDTLLQRKILYRDKCTVIEGMCAEVLFQRELVETSFSDFSGGWWHCKHNYVNVFTKLLVEPQEKLNELDYKIADHLYEQGLNVTIVKFHNRDKAFYELFYRGRIDFKKTWERNKKRLIQKVSQQIASQSENETIRHDLAADFLESKNILYKVTIERIYVNCFAKGYGIKNIDGFSSHNGKIIAFETKQKFPALNGTFGLNQGLADLFQLLSQKDIVVIHTILTKPVLDKDFSAVEQHQDPKLKEKSVWLGLVFNLDKHENAIKTAPKHTSVYGRNPVKYVEIETSKFQQIGIPGLVPKNSLLLLLENRSKKQASIPEIPSVAPPKK